MDLNITELNIEDTNEEFDFSCLEDKVTMPVKETVPRSILKTKPNVKEQKRVSYDDILSKMGMYVDNGQLHLAKKNGLQFSSSECGSSVCAKKSIANNLNANVNVNANANATKKVIPISAQENSYIYNKYFKDHIQPVKEVLVPKTPQEYKEMLLKKIVENKIQKFRIQQMKSTKLIMPTENIQVSSENTSRGANRFFNFSR